MPESQSFSYDQLFAALTQSQKYGFLSPQPIEGQIKHSQDFIDLCPKIDGKILDLGAGGGLPSLVWLYVRPEDSIVALDAMRKRTDFLEDIRSQYVDIYNRLSVVNGRAEEVARGPERATYSTIIARGFGAPAITAECAAGLLEIGGQLVVSGRPDNEQERWNEEGLKSLGLSLSEVRSSEKAHAAVIQKVEETSDRFPRKTPAMKKAPLWK